MSNSEEVGDKVDAEELETLFSLIGDKLYNRFIFDICHSNLCIICFRKHLDGNKISFCPTRVLTGPPDGDGR